jgi:hypothetical protein
MFASDDANEQPLEPVWTIAESSPPASSPAEDGNGCAAPDACIIKRADRVMARKSLTDACATQSSSCGDDDNGGRRHRQAFPDAA